MRNVPAILFGVLLFLFTEIVVFLPLYLIGLVTFPIWYVLAPIELSVSKVGPIKTITRFSWPWLDEILGNHEDGLAFGEWEPYAWFRRNPICNMRFWPILSTFPSRSVQHIGTAHEVPADGVPGWFFAWQGCYWGFRWQNTKYGVWIGWKLNPRDAQPNAPRDYRYWGLGTTMQFIRFSGVSK